MFKCRQYKMIKWNIYLVYENEKIVEKIIQKKKKKNRTITAISFSE